MAERRIAEKTGRGVVCFISNYSWLDGLSFTGMRERYLEAFDVVRIDCLNGDSRKTGKTTPDGRRTPASSRRPRIRSASRSGPRSRRWCASRHARTSGAVAFRQLWGQAKREELTETAEAEPAALYDDLSPLLPLGLPFAPMAVSDDWSTWPPCPISSPPRSRACRPSGTHSCRHRPRPPQGPHGRLLRPGPEPRGDRASHPAAMKSSSGFVVSKPTHGDVLRNVLARGGPDETGFVRYAYRPLRHPLALLGSGTRLLGRPVPDYKPHVFKGNLCLVSQHENHSRD